MSRPLNSGLLTTSESTSIPHAGQIPNGIQHSPSQNTKIMVPESQVKADLEMLEKGTFSDFTVICGDKKWNTHKVILNRCAYFKDSLSEDNGSTETLRSEISIDGFNEYEVSWLLRYIYGRHIDIQAANEDNPSKSFFETCVLLWRIGNYFILDGLADYSEDQLGIYCKELFIRTRKLTSVIRGISFLPDLEAGIRAAWRDGRTAAAPFLRTHLVQLCLGLSPFLREAESFLTLLDEFPQFAVKFSKALLGCPEENHLVVVPAGRIVCPACDNVMYDILSREVPANAFYTPRTSMAFTGVGGTLYCSRECYNSRTAPDLQYWD
ncbi:hypothetical protein VM1G_07493 [Cytospora mali]|uniref:BTB domain-containing protein n=1 Tax=Cytospora mali TaxID=578113 RepID=A0A194W6N1_CYTMA|nr:hypothetical protein VM1G_07493 [Valsa mali]